MLQLEHFSLIPIEELDICDENTWYVNTISTRKYYILVQYSNKFHYFYIFKAICIRTKKTILCFNTKHHSVICSEFNDQPKGHFTMAG